MEIDTRTNFQKRTDERREKVLSDFRCLLPKCKTPNHAMVIVARMNDLTRDGVRKILIDIGAYVPNSDNPVRL